jgi:DNA-binding SARP family transcriptional activator
VSSEAAIVRLDGVNICLLGRFRVAKRGLPVPLRSGGKVEQLLAGLALNPRSGASREELLARIWPTTDLVLAGRSLNTLVYWLHRTLGEALGGRSPVLHHDGRYRLNFDEGVTVDVLEFEEAAATGDRLTSAGDHRGAIEWYRAAAALYAGDFVTVTDVQDLIERERLRARYLSLRARLAEHYFALCQYGPALDSAHEVLAHDPCREDAHRMAMRCYVRAGERAQALRQYAVCREVLALEFDAPPEPSTSALFEQVRAHPETV